MELELTTTVSFSWESINFHWSLMKASFGRIPPNLNSYSWLIEKLILRLPFNITVYDSLRGKSLKTIWKRHLVNIAEHGWVKLRPSRFTLCRRPHWWQRRGLITTERPGRPGEAGARPVMARPRSQVHQHQTLGPSFYTFSLRCRNY